MFPYNQKRKKRKAATLTEVLIVLGVLSTTVVASMALLISGLQRLKTNEFEDVANQAMIQALEIAKSPADVLVDNANITGETFFSLDVDDDGNFILNKRTSTNSMDIAGCGSTNSIYYVGRIFPNIATEQLLVCVEITVTPRTIVGGDTIYEILSESIYNADGERKQSSIKGFRYEDFVTQ